MNYKDTIKRHEGVRYCAYKDSLGIWSIAVGENLERVGENEHLRSFGVNPDIVWAAIEEAKKQGKSKTIPLLNDTQVDALLDAEIDICLADLKNLFKNFDAMPEDAKTVLVDLRFQLGASGLRKFSNTVKAFKEGRFKDAAAGMRASLAYKQTPARWEENAKLLESV